MKEPGALRGLVFALLTGIIVSFKSNRRRMAGEQDGTGHCTARMSAKGVRRGKAAFSSGCKPHPATAPAGSIGAVMEETKWLKPSISVSRIGDSASVQAATRVNAEQASHEQVAVKWVVSG